MKKQLAYSCTLELPVPQRVGGDDNLGARREKLMIGFRVLAKRHHLRAHYSIPSTLDRALSSADVDLT